jgi:hypothetical protein
MLQSYDRRNDEEPNHAPRVPLDGRLRSSRQYCGPGPWTHSTLRVSRLGGASPCASKSRWAKMRGA